MRQQPIFLNLFAIRTTKSDLNVYRLTQIEPTTFNRQTKFRLAADLAKRLANQKNLVFSVGDLVYSVEDLKDLGPFEQTIDVTGTSVLFKAILEKYVEEQRIEKLPTEISTNEERLVNRLVDWYYRENVPSSFRMENANYKTDNIFQKLQANLYRNYKININEGSMRATRVFGNSLYLLLDTQYRVTWEDNLWESVKAYVRNDLNSDVTLPSPTTIRSVNEHYGRVGNKRGVRVQGRNRVGEYEILEFDFTKNPATSDTSKDGMSQIDYFGKTYGNVIEIKDKSQPLVKVRVTRGYFRSQSSLDWIYHVPELLELDRIPSHIRSNTKVNSAIVNITKPLPRSRFSHLLNFVQGDPFGKTKGFAGNAFVNQFIIIDSKPVEQTSQVLDPLEVRMGDKLFSVSNESEFLDSISKNVFHRVNNPKNLGLLFLADKKDQVLEFYDRLRNVSQKHGLLLPQEPQTAAVESIGYESFIQEIEKLRLCDLVISFGSSSEDLLYDALKQRLLVHYGILSQHITYENTLEKIAELELQQNQRIVESILTMISMQLCAKLGGAPWAFSRPIYEEDCPIFGLDIFHNEDGSVTGACAAFDPYGEYLFSNITQANVPAQKVIGSLNDLVEGVLKRYTQLKQKPRKIFVVRDGLSFTQEQQFVHGENGELALIDEALKKFGIDDYVFVMEKVGTNLRMFKKITDVKVENPESGTVLIGKPFSANEFLMVAQESYVGTVEPVLYKILRPKDKFDPQKIVNCIYQLSRHHWVTARSIKIPAPAYHADEITFLIRNVLGESPTSRNILDRPFYL